MKKFGIALAFVALAAAIGIGAGFYFTHNNGSGGTGGAITAEEAESIALKDAGVTAQEATGMSSHSDRDDGRNYIDVQFAVKDNQGTTLYEYDIDAKSGTVISKEKEQKTGAAAQQNTNTTTQTSNQQAAGEITADEAKQIALQHAGVNEADTLYVDVEYDHEHNVNEWNVDFETATTEYDYDISAVDGSILKSSNEPRG